MHYVFAYVRDRQAESLKTLLKLYVELQVISMDVNKMARQKDK